MKRILILFLVLSFLISIHQVFAGVGIGMGPTRLYLTSNLGNPYSANIIVYNPGDYDIKAKVVFDCNNCEQDANFFGWHIGMIKDDYTQFFSFNPEEVYVPNNTGPTSPVTIKVQVDPKLFYIRNLVISTPEEINFIVRGINPKYDGKFSIPYYSILIGEKDINGDLSMSATWTSFGPMGSIPAVGADFKLIAIGMPLGSLLIIIFIIICVVVLILWKIGFRRIYNSLPRIRKKQN